MGKPQYKVNPEQKRTRFTKEFKPDAVRLLELAIQHNQHFKRQEQLK